MDVIHRHSEVEAHACNLVGRQRNSEQGYPVCAVVN